jgi:hypothetical protein
MESRNADAVARVASLMLIALAVWLMANTFNGLPVPLGLDAAATEFSAARADATLGRLLGPEVPHPVSTPANQAVRDRVRMEFAALGVQTNVYRATGCFDRQARIGVFFCGTTEDIVADVMPGTGKAIILLAHYDSVPAGPGGADDQSGVATILETVRALKARGSTSLHPVLAVISDGEEAGLLGAAAFLDNPALKAKVGAVVNVEARGNQGPSLMFQTSPGNGRLIDLYANSVPTYATSSLTAVIYKYLPNDTDLTLFINAGFIGFNFAFSGNVAHYHTPLDRRDNLSLATLQNHGDNMLGIASGLMKTDFESLKGGDDVYISLLGYLLPRMPASWALPLAIASFLLVVAATYLSRDEENGVWRWLRALAMPLAMVVGCVAAGFVLHKVAELVSGQPNPSYAYPLWLRLALALGVTSVGVLVARLSNARRSALAVWYWMSGLAILTAALLPGLSPYFLFPSLIGSLIMLIQTRFADPWDGRSGEVAIFLAAIPALLIWLSLAAGAESVQGLFAHPLFTVPAAFGTMAFLPFLAIAPLGRRAWIWTSSLLGVAALLCAWIAGLQPAFSPLSPQRLNVDFLDDHVNNKSLWAIDTQAPLPEAFRHVMPFSDKPIKASPISSQPAYLAPAGPNRFPPPTAAFENIADATGRLVTLTLQGSERTNEMLLVVPRNSGLDRIEFEGKRFVPLPNAENPLGTVFGCVTRDCRNKSVTLHFAKTQPVEVWIAEIDYAIPPDGEQLENVRPATTVASQSGDTTIVFGKVKLP